MNISQPGPTINSQFGAGRIDSAYFQPRQGVVPLVSDPQIARDKELLKSPG